MVLPQGNSRHACQLWTDATAPFPDVLEAMVFNVECLGLFAAERRASFVFTTRVVKTGIDNESDQVSQEYPVDALALRGDEGRGTLR